MEETKIILRSFVLQISPVEGRCLAWDHGQTCWRRPLHERRHRFLGRLPTHSSGHSGYLSSSKSHDDENWRRGIRSRQEGKDSTATSQVKTFPLSYTERENEEKEGATVRPIALLEVAD